MEYVIENLTNEEIDIMESSDIEWAPDDISANNTDIVRPPKADGAARLLQEARDFSRVRLHMPTLTSKTPTYYECKAYVGKMAGVIDAA